MDIGHTPVKKKQKGEAEKKYIEQVFDSQMVGIKWWACCSMTDRFGFGRIPPSPRPRNR